MDKRTFAKFSAIVLTSIILGSILFYGGVAYGQSSTQYMTFTGGIYPGAPSYTVSELSGVYYAKDSYGAVAWSSTDAAYVINQAINSLPNYGYGSIVCVGRITLTDSIVFSGTKKMSFQFDYLTANGDFPVIDVDVVFAYTLNIKGNRIDYNLTTATSPVINLTCSGLTLNLNTLNNLGAGSSVLLGSGECYYNDISINEIANSAIGIKLDDGSGAYAINANRFLVGVHNSPSRVTVGFDLIGDKIACNVFSGSFQSNGAAGNIAFRNNGDNVNTVRDYFAYDLAASGSYAIYNTDGTIHVIGGFIPSFRLYNSGGVLDIVGADYAIGAFEAYGTAIIANATSVDVTHGLGGTPTQIIITGTAYGAGVNWVNFIGANTFRINVATLGNYTMYWYARYDP